MSWRRRKARRREMLGGAPSQGARGRGRQCATWASVASISPNLLLAAVVNPSRVEQAIKLLRQRQAQAGRQGGGHAGLAPWPRPP